jgi:hypothetical protein
MISLVLNTIILAVIILNKSWDYRALFSNFYVSALEDTFFGGYDVASLVKGLTTFGRHFVLSFLRI